MISPSAPWPPREPVDIGDGENPWGNVVLGRVDVLGAPLDRVLVLVARHARNVEEHATEGRGDARLDGAEAGEEGAVALATNW